MGDELLRIDVLYVDDEPSLLEVTKIYLEEADNLTVTTANDVKSGLELLRSCRFDIVVSDYQMPLIDGLDFLKSVRAEFDDMPFILFTGKGREAVVIEALNNGADYYVQKGVDVDAQFTELVHKIKLAVNKRHMEGRLSEAERRLREMLEQISLLSILLDREGNITYANRFAAKTLGVPVSELTGMNFFDRFVQKRSAEEQKSLYREMMRTGIVPAEMTGRVLTASGELRSMRFKSSPMRDKRGVIIGMSNIGEDITDLLKAQEERDMLTHAIKASTNEVYMFDADDLRFTFINEGALRRLGITAEEVIGQSPVLLRPNFDLDEFQERLDLLRQRKVETVEYETVHRCRDGTLYPVEVRLQMFETAGHRFFLGVSQDISQRKEMENELRMSESRYRNLVENFAGTVFVAELDSHYPMNVYGQVRNLTGFDAADFERHNISWPEVIMPDDMPIIAENLAAMRNDRSHVANMEFRIRRRDGTVRWVTAVWHIVSADGSPLIQGMMVDITPQKLFEEELQSSNEELQAAEEELKQQLEELTDSEERLRLSEERFHNLFIAMDEGVALHRLVTDKDGNFTDYVLVDVNPSYERILGIRREDVVGKTGTEVYRTPSPYLFEFTIPERTGRPHVFETYFPPMDKHFHISVVRVGRNRFATVFIDITEQKRREAKLRTGTGPSG